MHAPLQGIRILDFTRYQQGPFATAMLADMGAKVLKVEAPPRGGDYGRRILLEEDGFSGFFEALNRGKKSLCIDLREPDGRNLALQLGETCDFIVENFRVGVMEDWGLGYEAFKGKNERVIYASAAGWGTSDPMTKNPSFDQIAQAHIGFAQQSGGGPGHEPLVPHTSLADRVGGLNLAYGIMTALFARERHGIGQKLDVSLLGSMLAFQSPELQYALHYSRERARERRASPTIGEYQCADGKWVMVVALDQKFWPRFCSALGAPELAEDERYARGRLRWQQKSVLESTFEELFRMHDSAYWLHRLEELDVPCALVLSYVDLRDDPQAREAGYIVEREHPLFGVEPVIGPHMQLSETPPVLGAAAPELGQDTISQLLDHGLSPEAIQDLAGRGVIRGPKG